MDRKLDIIGIVLTIIGILVILSLISPEKSTFTGNILLVIKAITGWGSYLLPLALVGLGLWLIFRKFQQVPNFSMPRLTGILLFYVNILAWFHLIAGTTWQATPLGKGGGYLGGIFALGLKSLLGTAGTAVFLGGWLLVSIQLIFDLTLAEMFLAGTSGVRRIILEMNRRIKSLRAVRPSPAGSPPANPATPPPTPIESGFKKIEAIKPSSERSVKSRHNPTAIAAAPVTPVSAETPPQIPSEPVVEMPLPPQPQWKLPSISDILDPPMEVALQGSLDQDRVKVIEETLAAFGAPAHVVEINRGPSITQYGVEPDFVDGRTGKIRVRVNKIVSLADDLALALAAPRIRIEAPVPGHSYVGIEVPNVEANPVTLRELLESEAFTRLESPLRFALGKNVAGQVLAADLCDMPHLLIAGTTGSGKSVCINSILCAFLLYHSPSTLRLVLVDPKRVELTTYNGIPHLLTPVIVDAERVVGALQWVLREMDLRYQKFTKNSVRNIQEYNQKNPQEQIPYWVVVIDELADLMMMAPEETERSLTRLAQLARATGIHLIIATQRPSVNVVTGLIKANFPSRIAFAVASGMDSRVILDQTGAERLLGRGDMLFQAADAAAPVRLQGAYVSDSEIQLLVDYWRLHAAEVNRQSSASSQVNNPPRGVPLKQFPLWKEGDDPNQDPLLEEAIDIARREGRASITMFQRKLRIGYTRAAKIIDAMEAKGIIGPANPSTQVREVLDYGPAGPPPEEPD